MHLAWGSSPEEGERRTEGKNGADPSVSMGPARGAHLCACQRLNGEARGEELEMSGLHRLQGVRIPI